MNLSDETTGTVDIQSTHAIDIFAFVEADDIPFSCFETPYYLAPGPGGEKVYAVLREVLNRTGKIGIAQVVIHARQRLAALIPCGPALVLNILCMADELASAIRAQGPKPGQPTEKELAMAVRVVESMTLKRDSDGCPDASDFELTIQAPPLHPADILQSAVRLSDDEVIADARSIFQPPARNRPRHRARKTYH